MPVPWSKKLTAPGERLGLGEKAKKNDWPCGGDPASRERRKWYMNFD